MVHKSFSVAEARRRIDKTFRAIADECEDEVLDTIFTQAALLAASQRRVVPVEEGDLRQSIRVEKGRRKFQVLVKAGGPLTTKPVRNSEKGNSPTYDYALAQEFGTEKMPKNPFFYPVYRARRKDIKAAVRKAVKKAVVKAVR